MTNNENKIMISKPYIEEKENDLYRVCANIAFEGEDHLVFVEVEKEYKDYLVTERSDAFVFLVLPIAVREGYDIYCEAPITSMFLHNIENILIPAITKGDSRAYDFKIIADSDNSKMECYGGVGSSVTCGVDSTYTIMNYTQNKYEGMDITHLLVGSVSSDLWDFDEGDNLITWEEKHASRFQRYYTVSEYTGLPIVKLFTNFAPLIYERKKINESYTHVYLHIYITMGAVLAVKKLFGAYLLSSSHDYTVFSVEDNLTNYVDNYQIILDHVLTTSDFVCFSGGGNIDRIEKTIALTDYPLAQKILHPCFKDTPINCSSTKCSKCLRALFTLDYYDKLDKMSEIFDVERYRKNRDKYLISLIKSQERSNFQKLYNMFMEKYPKDMERAQKKYDREKSYVSKKDYNALVKVYDIILLLVSEDEPKKTVTKFFKEKNISKLYYAGHSRFGNKIISLLDDSIEIVTFKTGNVNDCDAIFMGTADETELQKNKESIKNKLNKDIKIYTFADIRESLEK